MSRPSDGEHAADARFRSVFEQAAIGMGRVRFDDARWIDANDVLCRLVGRTREEMLGTPWPEITHPDDVDLDLVPFRRMAAGEIESYSVEKRFLHKQGHAVWTRLTLSLVRDAEGRPDYEIAVVEDISDRKQAEAALRAGEERLRSVMEHMAEGLVIFDAAGSITYQNPASVRIHAGRLAGDHRRLDRLVVSWQVRSYPQGALVPPERWAIPRVLRGERVVNEHFFVDCVEEPERSFVGLYNGGPVHDAEGRLAYGFLTIQEITEQVRAEEALRRANAQLREADRRKNDFLALLSHELRNPLAPIRNSLFVLDRVPPAGEQAAHARAVLGRQVAQLTRLVDDLLDVTRISRGKLRLERERLDLVELVRRAADDHRGSFAEHGLALEVRVPNGGVWIEADRTRLTQLVGNLLGNAAKFTPAGGSATIGVEQDTSAELAVLRVRDTGIGIAPEMLPRVFDAFAQAHDALDRSRGGLGLGLAMVKGMVELHGGSVQVESGGAGQGAEFTVRLPLARAERSVVGRNGRGARGS